METAVCKTTSRIPVGPYCYRVVGNKKYTSKYFIGDLEIAPCPYHRIISGKPEQESGYCEYLHFGDWEKPGLSLLWDLCKECGVNEEDEPV